MPYGIKLTTAIFQRKVEKTFKEYPFIANLLNDIVVTERDVIKHYNNLIQVLECCKTVGFKLNSSKCVFFQNEIKYLKHIIDKQGLKTDPSNVDSIIKFRITSFK